MELHEFNQVVILLTAPAAEGLTLVRHWGGLTRNSSWCTGSYLCQKDGVHALRGPKEHIYERKVATEE